MVSMYSTTQHAYSFYDCIDVVKLYYPDWVNDTDSSEMEALTLNEILKLAGADGSKHLVSFSNSYMDREVSKDSFEEFIDAFKIASNRCWSRVRIPDKHYVASVTPKEGFTLVITLATWKKGEENVHVTS